MLRHYFTKYEAYNLYYNNSYIKYENFSFLDIIYRYITVRDIQNLKSLPPNSI